MVHWHLCDLLNHRDNEECVRDLTHLPLANDILSTTKSMLANVVPGLGDESVKDSGTRVYEGDK